MSAPCRTIVVVLNEGSPGLPEEVKRRWPSIKDDIAAAKQAAEKPNDPCVPALKEDEQGRIVGVALDFYAREIVTQVTTALERARHLAGMVSRVLIVASPFTMTNLTRESGFPDDVVEYCPRTPLSEPAPGVGFHI